MKITIHTKVALVLILASVIPLAIAVTFAYHHRAADARILADHDVRERAKDCAARIGREVESLCAQARRLAADPAVVRLLQECLTLPDHAENETVDWAALPADDERLQSLLQNQASRHIRALNKSFRTVLLHDPAGRLVAATGQPAAEGPPGWLNACLAGDTDVPVLIAETGETGAPGMSICTSIREESGQALGVARAVIDTGRLLDTCIETASASAAASLDIVCGSTIVASSDRQRVGLILDLDSVQDGLIRRLGRRRFRAHCGAGRAMQNGCQGKQQEACAQA